MQSGFKNNLKYISTRGKELNLILPQMRDKLCVDYVLLINQISLLNIHLLLIINY
jgi:hypothetical protein